ncbi:MAG: exodeoxyribonuclease V subunit gamma, partial [Deltaproteobacteria bacterium]|nr:exodeoxyribonuclease V subunit gamma [Deltaproteobacteria bacterium]
MLHLHRSNRLEKLADALADILKDPLPAPGIAEWVGIQTQGIAVWLKMALSKRLGIWANGYHPFPRTLIENIFSKTLGVDPEDTSACNPKTMTWAILSLLPSLLSHKDFGLLKRYLSGDGRMIKRYQLSRRIARV